MAVQQHGEASERQRNEGLVLPCALTRPIRRSGAGQGQIIVEQPPNGKDYRKRGGWG